MNLTRQPVLVVCGLAAEARVAAGQDVVAIAAPPTALAARLDAFDGDIGAVLSFGLAGGLSAATKAGTLVVSTGIRAEDGGEWRCDPAIVEGLSETLHQAGLAVVTGSTVCRGSPVVAARDKAALHRETGAIAVDTESHLAAAYAQRRGLPFVALRAVCDAADADLPPLAVRAIDGEGRLDWRFIGGELRRHPGQLLALPGTALATLRAMRSLRRARGFLGSRLGL